MKLVRTTIIFTVFGVFLGSFFIGLQSYASVHIKVSPEDAPKAVSPIGEFTGRSISWYANPAGGKMVFIDAECIDCHAVKGVDGVIGAPLQRLKLKELFSHLLETTTDYSHREAIEVQTDPAFADESELPKQIQARQSSINGPLKKK